MDIKDVAIPMRDGKNLKADIFLPSKTGKFPTILILTPYNRKYIAAALPDASLKTELFDRTAFAYVVADWRGFFGSKAAKSRRAKNGEDGYDTVEWIAKQPWSSGKVGMWGISAPGKVGFYTAEERPPHLTCIAPIVAAYGYRYNQFFHGGVLKKSYVYTVTRVGFNLRRLLAHPIKDKFWQLVAESNRTPRINVPIFLVTGWYDLYVEGIIDTYYQIKERGGPEARRHIKMLIGPWNHCFVGKTRQGELQYPNAALVYDHELRRFFEYWLLDKKDNGWDKEPRIRYIQLGSNQWEYSSDWPPQGRNPIIYYLQSGGGKLVRDGLDRDTASDSFRYDPTDPSPTIGGLNVSAFWDPSALKVASGPMDQRTGVESRDDNLSFSTAILDSDVVVRGVSKVKLYVSSDRRDTDFAVRLCDVYPDGRSILVTDGIQRMRYRNSLSGQELMEPHRVYEVTVALSTTAITFKKGHRIRIIVSSSDYPRFDTNPNTDRKRLLGPRSLPAINTLYFGRKYKSALMLP